MGHLCAPLRAFGLLIIFFFGAFLTASRRRVDFSLRRRRTARATSHISLWRGWRKIKTAFAGFLPPVTSIVNTTLDARREDKSAIVAKTTTSPPMLISAYDALFHITFCQEVSRRRDSDAFIPATKQQRRRHWLLPRQKPAATPRCDD